jgi:hypothetical protein
MSLDDVDELLSDILSTSFHSGILIRSALLKLDKTLALSCLLSAVLTGWSLRLFGYFVRKLKCFEVIDWALVGSPGWGAFGFPRKPNLGLFADGTFCVWTFWSLQSSSFTPGTNLLLLNKELIETGLFWPDLPCWAISFDICYLKCFLLAFLMCSSI